MRGEYDAGEQAEQLASAFRERGWDADVEVVRQFTYEVVAQASEHRFPHLNVMVDASVRDDARAWEAVVEIAPRTDSPEMEPFFTRHDRFVFGAESWPQLPVLVRTRRLRPLVRLAGASERRLLTWWCRQVLRNHAVEAGRYDDDDLTAGGRWRARTWQLTYGHLPPWYGQLPRPPWVWHPHNRLPERNHPARDQAGVDATNSDSGDRRETGDARDIDLSE